MMAQDPNTPQSGPRNNQPPYQTNGNFYAGVGQPVQGSPVDSGARNLAIGSLALGILSIITAFIFSLIGVAMGIVGIILARKAKPGLPVGDTGMATAGFVCSIIGLCLSSLSLLFVLFLVGGLATLGLLAF